MQKIITEIESYIVKIMQNNLGDQSKLKYIASS